jgi:hypothetical protein
MNFFKTLAMVGLVGVGMAYGEEHNELKRSASSVLESQTPQKINIFGIVTDENGHPVAKAIVNVNKAVVKTGTSTLCPSCYSDCRKSTTTDQKGRFEIKDVAGDLLFELLVVSTGYQPQYTESFDPQKSPIRIKMKPRAKSEKGRELTGAVIDSNGQPVSHAEVTPYGYVCGENEWFSVPGLEAMAISDETGKFSLMVDKKYSAAMLEISANGYAPKKYSRAILDNKAQKYVLDPGAMVEGRLMQQGKPVQGADLGIFVTDGSMSQFFSEMITTTGEDGRFRFSNVPANREYFLYGLRGTLKDRGVTQSKTIRTGDPSTTLNVGDLELESGMKVHGEIILNDGQPVPQGTRIQIGHPNSWDPMVCDVGQDGKFTFRAIQGEKIGLSIYIKGYTLEGAYDPFHRSKQCVINDTPLKLKFTRLPRIEGKVINPDGKPSADAEITLIDESVGGADIINGKLGPPWFKIEKVRTDADGMFKISSTKTQATNYHLLAVGSNGYAVIPESEFQGSMTLSPWCRVEGRAMPGNLPATNDAVFFQMILHGCKDIGWYVPCFNNVSVERSGKFVLEKLPQGVGVISLNKPSGKRYDEILRKEIAVTEKGNGTVTLGGMGSSISGAVFLSNSLKSETNWYQMLFAENDPMHLTYTFQIRQDGSFEIKNVPPGDYRLNISFNHSDGNNMSLGKVSTNISVASVGEVIKIPVMVLQSNVPTSYVGKTFPAFTSTSADGRVITNKDLLGKVTVIHFDLNSGKGGLFSQVAMSENYKSVDKKSDRFQIITFRPNISERYQYPVNDPRNVPWPICFFDSKSTNSIAAILGVKDWDTCFVTDQNGKIIGCESDTQHTIWGPVDDALKSFTSTTATQDRKTENQRAQ